MSRPLLTDEELKVLELLRQAVNAFFLLPEHHPQDIHEFAHEVHQLQHRVMCRAARREYPEVFTRMVPRDEARRW